MNLMSQDKNVLHERTISNFRNKQYELIPYFCKLIINYISEQGGDYLKFIGYKIQDVSGYFGAFDSQIQELTITVEMNGEQNVFLKIIIPKLIQDDFFYLNGNYYIPTLYVVDHPITIKKSSIMLYGLFNSLTLYMKDDIAIFTGVNIPLSMFLQIFLGNDQEGIDLSTKLLKKYKRVFKLINEVNILSYVGKKFNFQAKNMDDVRTFIEKLLFDDYTFRLYQNIYGNEFEINLTNIVKKSASDFLDNNVHNFVDLEFKRVVFVELLLRPIFDKISTSIKQLWFGLKYNEMRIDQLAVIKYYRTSPDAGTGRKGLSGNYLYDTLKNLYSGILKHKISMVPPGTENAPKEVQAIHNSHFGRICPITISSQKPGHTVSIIPDTPIDEFGVFL